MGLFVNVMIDKSLCREGCKICFDCCPVSIFLEEKPKTSVDEENVDECTFCDLCLERCPTKAIKIIKNY